MMTIYAIVIIRREVVIESMNIGHKIKEIRMQKGITQKELAQKLKTSQQNLAQYENGKRNPKIQTLTKIADALEVPLSSLYEDNKTPLYNLSSHTRTHVSETITPYSSDSPNGTMDTHGNSALSRKDEKDIAKDLNTIMQKLRNGEDGPVSFEGTDIPAEDLELFAGQIELMLRRLKTINKEKYSSKNAPKDADN